MEPVKKPFKINKPGLIRLEPDNMTTKEIVLVMAVAFVVGLMLLLKVYALPILAFPGAITNVVAIIQIFKSRGPLPAKFPPRPQMSDNFLWLLFGGPIPLYPLVFLLL